MTWEWPRIRTIHKPKQGHSTSPKLFSVTPLASSGFAGAS
jgi:hypothetical protein